MKALLILSVAIHALWAFANTRLVDRLLIEIEQTSYSQRQAEIHYAARCLLQDQPLDRCIAGAGNWQLVLNSFTSDMLTLHHARRTGAFQPRKKAVAAAVADITAKLNQDKEFARTSARLQIHPDDWSRAVIDLITLESFRRRQQNMEKRNELTEKLWLQDMRERTFLRNFAGAETYIIIHPGLAQEP